MIFYIFVFSICTIAMILNTALRKPKEKNIVGLLTLAMLCIISGTRYDLGGTDYFVYERIFDTTPEIWNFSTGLDVFLLRYEIGYLWLNSLIKTLGFNFYGFTLIHSIIFYTCMYVGLKRYICNFNFFLVVFLYKLFFYNTFISLRQSLAIAIFFVILHYIQDKKPLQYFIGSTIAVLFHYAALIFYPIYFINKLTLTKKKLIFLNIVFIPSMLISFLQLPLLEILSVLGQFFPADAAQQKFEGVVSSTNLTGISILHTLEYFLIMFLLVINYESIKKLDSNSDFLTKIFLCLLPLFTTLRGYEILTRQKDFFTFSFAIILGYLCLIKNKKYLGIVQGGTLVICAYGFFRFIMLFDDGGMMPYESYLWKDVSIFQ